MQGGGGGRGRKEGWRAGDSGRSLQFEEKVKTPLINLKYAVQTTITKDSQLRLSAGSSESSLLRQSESLVERCQSSLTLMPFDIRDGSID